MKLWNDNISRQVCLLLVLFSHSMWGYCQPGKLLIDGEEQQLGPFSAIYQDKTAAMSPEQAVEQQFVPVSRAFVPFADENGSYWLRFSLQNNSQYREKRIFSFDYPHIETLSLYTIENGMPVEQAFTKAELPFQQRAITSRFPALLFDLDADSTTDYLLHIQLAGKANHALEYELKIYPEDRFFNEQLTSFIIFSGFTGFMLSLMIYNLILFRRLAIRGYLYYGLFLASQFIGIMSYEGFFYLVPGISNIKLNIVLVTIAPTLSGIFLINFGRDLLDLKQSMPRSNRLYSIVTLALIVLMLFSPLELSWLNLFMEVLMLSMIVLTAVLSIRIFLAGSQAAMYLVLSFLVITLGYGVEILLFSVENLKTSLAFLSVETLYWMERYFYYTCSFIQMILLSSSLANYVAEMRSEHDKAQTLVLEKMQESNRLRQEYSSQLERDIQERTREVTRQSEIMAEQTARLQQLDKLKSRFFTNISHEFRTPLTLIRGPVQRFLAGDYGALGEKAGDALNICARNIDRLSRLIDELLMLSELESGSLELKTCHSDMGQFCRRTAGLFVHTAQERNIEFKLNIPDQPVLAYYDPNKLEKVICNLLSNAFKYTPRGGEVQFNLRVAGGETKSTGNFIAIAVEDNGPGISRDERDNIFERFYRSANTDDYVVEGSGIGLALVKELTELHGGDISLESVCKNEVAKTAGDTTLGGFASTGSRFTVSLPLGSEHLDVHEISMAEHVVSADETVAGEGGPSSEEVSGNSPTLLIVEDNSDMRDFIVSHFDHRYRVLTATHGKEAIEKLAAAEVDLVISDVMMPEMDGISLLEYIRNEDKLRYLPVIMLTARASDEDRLLALRAQADDFLAKPFNPEELSLKVSNLLTRQLRVAGSPEHSNVVSLETGQELKSADAEFLVKATEITRQQLGNPDFDVDALAESLHMSRSTLQRHMKAAAVSPAQFIRQLRLEAAHQLISSETHRTMAETAYAVGFSHPGYFSKLYKKYLAQLEAG